ncbi:MAG: ABC transporter permease, partial [Ilumatobacteraceae bacterium]
ELRTERAAAPAAAALAIFAVVVAVLGLLLIGQAISRRLQLDARDNEVYAVVGATRLQRFGASMLRISAAAVAGSVVAVGLAWAMSWFTPVGHARRAEPDRGFLLHPSMVWGAVALLVALLVVASLPAWWSARRSVTSRSRRGSVFAAWLGSMGAAPSTTTGVRFGLEPGRGSTAVPTRASIVGATTAVAITVATVVFASSLDLVVAESRFYGSNYDDVLEISADGSPITETNRTELLDRILSDPAVLAASEQRVGDVEVDGERLPAVAFSRGPSAVEPTIARGRAPDGVDEIALGSLTMAEIGLSIGDVVAVRSARYDGMAEVVGQVVLPGLGYHRAADKTALGSGALVVPEALRDPLTIEDTARAVVVVTDLEGGDPSGFRARVGDEIVMLGVATHTEVARPSDIRSLGGLRSVLIGLVPALLALVTFTVVHTMIVAVRRRRRDLAVLEAVGATSRDLRRIGIWQGVTVGVAALLFGVPVGVIVGRWSWIALAERFGTIAEPVVPSGGIVAVIVVIVAMSAVVGVVPVQRGLRLRPSEVLRSE